MRASGRELRENNEKIVKLIGILKTQRDEMDFLIQKQQEEKTKIQNEIERLSFKLSLLTKSLTQRQRAKMNYDKTINDIDENYSSLVEESGKLLYSLTKEVHQLEQIMDKKTSTAGENTPENKSPSKELIKEPSGEKIPKKISSKHDDPKKVSSKSSNTKKEEPEHETLNPQSDQTDEIVQSEDGKPEEEEETESKKTKSETLSSVGSSRRSSVHSSERRSTASSTRRKSSDSSRKKSFDSDNKAKNAFNRHRSSIDRKPKSRGSSKTSMESFGSPPKKSSVEESDGDLGIYKELMDRIPPPINAKSKDDDIEIQSYRQAYGRQHNAPSPSQSAHLRK